MLILGLLAVTTLTLHLFTENVTSETSNLKLSHDEMMSDIELSFQ